MQAWPYPRWIAHRGAGKLAPENTLAAFRLGAAHGYRMFECDVKLAADGVPFRMHDASLARSTNAREQFGTPEEVYHTPASTFVASFIGSPPMNLLKNAQGGRPGALMGIRPEHLDVGQDGWAVKVETVELLGAERLVYGRLGEEQIIIRTDEEKPAPANDSIIHVKPREERLHWFDAATGKRI